MNVCKQHQPSVCTEYEFDSCSYLPSVCRQHIQPSARIYWFFWWPPLAPANQPSECRHKRVSRKNGNPTGFVSPTFQIPNKGESSTRANVHRGQLIELHIHINGLPYPREMQGKTFPTLFLKLHHTQPLGLACTQMCWGCLCMGVPFRIQGIPMCLLKCRVGCERVWFCPCFPVAKMWN